MPVAMSAGKRIGKTQQQIRVEVATENQVRHGRRQRRQQYPYQHFCSGRGHYAGLSRRCRMFRIIAQELQTAGLLPLSPKTLSK
jgi:hypothetical protein